MAAASVSILLSIGILQYRSTKSFPGKLINEQLPRRFMPRGEAFQPGIFLHDVDQMVKTNHRMKTIKSKTALADLSPSDLKLFQCPGPLIKVVVRTTIKTWQTRPWRIAKSCWKKMFIELLFMLKTRAMRSTKNKWIHEELFHRILFRWGEKIQNRINSISWRLFHKKTKTI